jgi:SAM-dependent methyltransferase
VHPMAMRRAWNHNLHYHDVVMRAVPPQCSHALDVGCGQGELAQRLATVCNQVTALDCAAIDRPAAAPNVAFLAADFMRRPLPKGSFDLIAAVAVLHHLPLRPALARFAELLRPGGVLAVIGLYRLATPIDLAIGCCALPISWTIRRCVGEAQLGAPIQDPKETLRDIRAAAQELLPGAVVRRRFFFRYSLLWKKPQILS